MFNASTLLLMLRHLCYMGRHVLCFNTSAQYCTVPSGTYCVVFLSFSIRGHAGRHLYVVCMNNIIHEIKSTQLCSVIYTDKNLFDKNLNNEQEESIRNLNNELEESIRIGFALFCIVLTGTFYKRSLF